MIRVQQDLHTELAQKKAAGKSRAIQADIGREIARLIQHERAAVIEALQKTGDNVPDNINTEALNQHIATQLANPKFQRVIAHMIVEHNQQQDYSGFALFGKDIKFRKDGKDRRDKGQKQFNWDAVAQVVGAIGEFASAQRDRNNIHTQLDYELQNQIQWEEEQRRKAKQRRTMRHIGIGVVVIAGVYFGGRYLYKLHKAGKLKLS